MNTGINLLIVDDDKMLAETLRDICVLNNIDTDIATSGKDALTKVQNKRYDCLISDVKMHKLSGIDLAHKVKRSYPKTKIILITAYRPKALLEEKNRSVADKILIKPIDPDEILDFLNNLK